MVTRRVFEASSRVLPFMALAFLPVAFGVQELYPWARPEQVATDELLQHRAPYLNVSFFYVARRSSTSSLVGAGVPDQRLVAEAGRRARRRKPRRSGCSG